MTTKQLRSYRSICAEIEDLEKELQCCYVGDTVQSGSRFPHNVRSVHIEGYKSDGGTVSKMSRLSELKKKREKVEQFVDGIPDYQIRKAVRLYYIEPIEDGEDKSTWEDVADEVGNGVTSNSLKTALKKILKNGHKGHERHTCHKSVC